jgi:hypothetical protein
MARLAIGAEGTDVHDEGIDRSSTSTEVDRKEVLVPIVEEDLLRAGADRAPVRDIPSPSTGRGAQFAKPDRGFVFERLVSVQMQTAKTIARYKYSEARARYYHHSGKEIQHLEQELRNWGDRLKMVNIEVTYAIQHGFVRPGFILILEKLEETTTWEAPCPHQPRGLEDRFDPGLE